MYLLLVFQPVKRVHDASEALKLLVCILVRLVLGALVLAGFALAPSDRVLTVQTVLTSTVHPDGRRAITATVAATAAAISAGDTAADAANDTASSIEAALGGPTKVDEVIEDSPVASVNTT